MKLSESLRKNIMSVNVGSIVNKFKAHSRRNVLFFEDIMANYIKECQEEAYDEDIRNICQKCMHLITHVLPPPILKKLPVNILFNNFLRRAWISIGALEDIHLTKDDDIIKIRIRNEQITRIIGQNEYTPGLLIGILEILHKHKIECIKKVIRGDITMYEFKITNKPLEKIEAKDKILYNKLNYFKKTKGIGFKDALVKGTFQIKDSSRTYFRSKSVMILENTLFHLLSNSGILINRISHISYKFFKNIVEKESSFEGKLILLKNILQIMGWGIVNVSMIKKDKIILIIKNPPYGLQKEKDNWNFLVQMILGYLWILNKKFILQNMKIDNKILTLSFETK